MKRKHKLIVGGSIFTATISMFFLKSNILDSFRPPQDTGSSISISPKQGAFPIDSPFDIMVTIDAKQSINAAEATINFDPTSLEVVKLSKDSSIFSLWLQEPIYSNASGSIQFSGGIPNGYQGDGQLFTVTFKPKKAGSASLTFSNATILANDGEGTETLKTTVNGDYTIKHVELSPDFNNDGKTDIKDVSILLTHWGKSNSTRYNAGYDLNQDGEVDLVDISIMFGKIK